MSEQGADAGSQVAAGSAAALPLTAADEESAVFAADQRVSFRYTRWVFLRSLGFIYVVAFAILVNQGQALIGSQGLLPATRYLERIKRIVGFAEHPTLFWSNASDGLLRTAAVVGLCLSLLMLAGVDHLAVSALLWLLYLSFVHIGQIFYGYGWETLLLETGFLAILIYKLLYNDPGALGLIANQPFPDAPPRFIRAERYRYRFTKLGAAGYWERERIGSYAPAFSRDDPRLLRFLQSYGLR